MGFWDWYPRTDFHELNLDWILRKIKYIEEISPAYEEKNGIVRYFYVDQNAGSDLNDGLTVNTPFQTLGKALDKLNEGLLNVGVYFLSGGTYYIPTQQRVFAHCTLHLSVINPVDVTIKSVDDRLVGYNVHFSFYGMENHPLVFEISTWRMDGGQLWGEYLDIQKGIGLNSCGARLRWCTFRGFSFNNNGNIHFESPTFVTTETEYETEDGTIMMWSCVAGCVYINGELTLINENQQPWYASGCLFGVRGGLIGLSSALTNGNTLDSTMRIHYFAHTYGGRVIGTDDVKTLLSSTLFRSAIINTGNIW